MGGEGEFLLIDCLETKLRHLVSKPDRYIYLTFFKEGNMINSFTRLTCTYPLGTRCSFTKVDFPAANECNHNCY